MDAFLDCSTTGISGDKFLGAAIDAGADETVIRDTLDALDLGIELSIEQVMRGGIRALHARVEGPEDPPRRDWREIEALLRSASIPAEIRNTSLAVFESLAAAEGEAHGIAPSEVHFHEVGAVDAIGEIVGVAAALESLGVERLTVSSVALGSGTVECEHGILPVPAPATALLTRDIPVCAGCEESELTTPTGAALVSTLADSFGPMPSMTSSAIGSGAGSRETASPNIARLFIGTPDRATRRTASDSGSPPLHTESLVLLATTVDHLTGERAAFALERILAAGALDAWMTPTLMKKGRPGLVFEALARPEMAQSLTSAIIEQTGSLGVRITGLERLAVSRQSAEATTKWGPVRVKIADLPTGKSVRAEADDCMRIAREYNVSFEQVAKAAEDAAPTD